MPSEPPRGGRCPRISGGVPRAGCETVPDRRPGGCRRRSRGLNYRAAAPRGRGPPTVALAQLVRAPDCDSGGRRFKSGMPPLPRPHCSGVIMRPRTSPAPCFAGGSFMRGGRWAGACSPVGGSRPSPRNPAGRCNHRYNQTRAASGRDGPGAPGRPGRARAEDGGRTRWSGVRAGGDCGSPAPARSRTTPDAEAVRASPGRASRPGADPPPGGAARHPRDGSRSEAPGAVSSGAPELPERVAEVRGPFQPSRRG